MVRKNENVVHIGIDYTRGRNIQVEIRFHHDYAPDRHDLDIERMRANCIKILNPKIWKAHEHRAALATGAVEIKGILVSETQIHHEVYRVKLWSRYCRKIEPFYSHYEFHTTDFAN